jgi:hypothetical protein
MKIKILACPVDREPYITNIENSLKNMQDFIGGYIEAETILQAPEVVLVCDEEGVLNEKKPNPSIKNIRERGLWMPEIVGDCFFCGVRGEEVADLPDKWKAALLKLAKEAYRGHKEEHGYA